MSALRLATSRIPISRVVQSRALSANGTVAVVKLRGAFEEYRQRNYDRELPSRFKKDILKAATKDHANVVDLDSLQQVLANIQMENRLSTEEITTIFEELGNGKEIPAQSMIQFI